MYTDYTYQDWLRTTEVSRSELILRIISTYKAGEEFLAAQMAERYFHGTDTAVASKVILQPRKLVRRTADGRTKTFAGTRDVVGNRIASNFLFRFVTQQNQFLLGHGVTLDSEETKARLGAGFDKALEQAGEKALLHGVCWGFWNADHLEILPAYVDGMSGMVALLDERTGAPGVGIQFWQMGEKRPMYVRLFEADGLTEYVQTKDGLEVTAPKRAYVVKVMRDAAGETITGARNYGALPLVPFYASEAKRSELTPAIKSKIDLYDRILSDFGDNLDRANDVYWVLNNFGGTSEDVVSMLEEIRAIKAVANFSDGTGSASTAEPRTIEVPYAARQTALDLLRKALYQDYMALDMTELTGGSLTNVAIRAAAANLNLKADRYEWQAFAFVQGVLRLLGIETEEIRFTRQQIGNDSETVSDIALMRDYIDDQTALELNPYILQEQIEDILRRKAAEKTSSLSLEETERALAMLKDGADDGQSEPAS